MTRKHYIHYGVFVFGTCSTLMMATVFGLLPAYTDAAAVKNNLPIGYLDSIKPDGTVYGWTLDPDTQSQQITVQFYLDSTASKALIGSTVANLPRPDVNATTKYLGDHGFTWNIPSQYLTSSHTLYAYGIDSTQSTKKQLLISKTTFGPKTSKSGSMLYLDTGVVKIGLNTKMGGSITEFSQNGTNFVNSYDPGREVQPALYDGSTTYDNCAGCSGNWGWNPVQAGDAYGHGSKIVSSSVTATSLYVKTAPYQWIPNQFGGSAKKPALSDAYIEEWVTAVPGYPSAVKVHYKITHFGKDNHTSAFQELPAVYTNIDYDHFVFYNGTAPWSGGTPTTTYPLPPIDKPTMSYTPELWFSLVNAGDTAGMTVYAPQGYPYSVNFTFPGSSGPQGWGTNYARLISQSSFPAGKVTEGDYYLIGGNPQSAQQVVYALHQSIGILPDINDPMGSLDVPAKGAIVKGVISVLGWALDDTSVQAVTVSLDNTQLGTATYGTQRPDVATVYPNAPAAVGYSYSLDTTKFANGQHTLKVSASDPSGNANTFSEQITVAN